MSIIPATIPVVVGIIPPKPEPVNATITVSLTAAEKKALSAAAKAAGTSMSAWTRAAVVSALHAK